MTTTLKKKSKKPKSPAPIAPAPVKPTMLKPHEWTDGGDKVLILRRCNADGSSKNGFVYPKSGPVECPDWNSEAVCGGGLHGWPWGWCLGEGADYSIIDDAWLVIAAKPEASSGDWCEVSASGKDTLTVAAGKGCRVKVGERGAFAIPYWNEKYGWRFLCGKAGEDGIEADTWYRVDDGKLVKAEEARS